MSPASPLDLMTHTHVELEDGGEWQCLLYHQRPADGYACGRRRLVQVTISPEASLGLKNDGRCFDTCRKNGVSIMGRGPLHLHSMGLPLTSFYVYVEYVFRRTQYKTKYLDFTGSICCLNLLLRQIACVCS